MGLGVAEGFCEGVGGGDGEIVGPLVAVGLDVAVGADTCMGTGV